MRRRAGLFGLAVVALAGLGISSAALLASARSAPMLLTLDRSQPQPRGSTVSIDSTAGPGAAVAAWSTTAEPVAVSVIEPKASDVRWFNGRPIRPSRTISMLVTAYSPDERSCGTSADGITASGYSVWTNGGKMVAADTRLLPLGSLVSVPGYDQGHVVPVLDRGGKIKNKRLDVLYPTHAAARKWGARRLDVVVWEYADGKPADFKTQHRRRR